jgi:hypothetical protein
VNYYGPQFLFTRPDTVFTAWVNQGGATATNVNGSINLVAPAAVSGELRARVVSVTVPYTLTAALTVGVRYNGNVNNDGGGIGVRDSASGKMQVFLYNNSGNLIGFNYTNATTFSAIFGSSELMEMKAPIIWERLKNDGVNRTYSISSDGVNWLQLYSVAFNNFLVEDQLSLVAESASGAGYPAVVNLFSWLVGP